MFLILDVSDIYDDGRTVSTVRRDTSQEYQRFLPPVSEHELCERVRQRVPEPVSTTEVWRGVAYC